MTAFISYTHDDEALRKELEKHLTALTRQKLLSIWHDRRIVPGAPIDDVIDKNLESADLVLLLVSAGFVHSDYCYNKEMMRAFARHDAGQTRIVPILVRPCDFSGLPFASLLMLPTDARAVTTWPNQDEAWLDVSRGIRRVLETHLKPADKLSIGETLASEPKNPAIADEFLLRAFRLSQKAEKLLREQFKAAGNGLGELIRDARSKVRQNDPKLFTVLSRFAPVRNALVHREKPDLKFDEVGILLDEVEAVLYNYLNPSLNAQVLALEPRQWFVCANNLGDYISISEAVEKASDGDQIFVLPGRYNEDLSLYKAVSLIGRGEDPGGVTIEAANDCIEISASGVKIENLTVTTKKSQAFGIVLLPGSNNAAIDRCNFHVPAGFGLVALPSTSLKSTDCDFDRCKIAVRIEATASISEGIFSENHHGILARNNADFTVERCSFRSNKVGIELQDYSRAQILQNAFENGSVGVVAADHSRGQITKNSFSGFDPEMVVVKMAGVPQLVLDDN